MKDIEIVQQLMDGNHLSNPELDRAQQILFLLGIALDGRIREGK